MKENDDLFIVAQQRNLVYNYDFRYFSNRVINGEVTKYGIPDGWTFYDDDKNSIVDFNEELCCLAIQKGSKDGVMSFSQNIHEFPRWEEMLKGNIISARVEFESGTDGDVTFSLTDGIDGQSNKVSKKGKHEIEIQLKINPDAKVIKLSLETHTPFIRLNITRIYANLGVLASKYLPCIVQGIIGERKSYIATEFPPAEELSLCEKQLELTEEYSRLDSVLNGRFGKGTNNRSLLPDIRGYFSRAWNNGSQVDPDAQKRRNENNIGISGDHAGTFEDDIFLKHSHGLNFSPDKVILTGDKGSSNTIDTTVKSNTNNTAEGNETRPKNFSELYTIKWA